MSTTLPYLQGYPADALARVQAMLDDRSLGAWLLRKYPEAHGIRSDAALFAYVRSLRQAHMRTADSLSKVRFDNKLQVRNMLGAHTTVSRVQGGRLKAKREISIAAMFRDAPEPFLRMIAVHELAHLREREHQRAFYQLCEHMEPGYHQLEFETRLYLTWLDAGGERLWQRPEAPLE